MALGFTNAATEYFSERLFGGNPVYDKDVGLVNWLVGKVVKNPTVMKVLSSTPVEILNEGLEEMVSGWLNPVWEWAITGNEPEWKLDELIEEGATGVITALLAQGGAAVMNKAVGSNLLNDTVADDVLRDRSAINFLKRKGGLELTSHMTQAEKRQAVKEAVDRITAVQEETVLPEGKTSTIIEVDNGPFTIGTSVGAKAKNYDVMDLESGEMYHFVEGSKIQNVNIFAGKGSHIPFRKASFFAQRYGGLAEDWQYVKGYALLETPDGDRMAEVHWVQCGEIGKFEFL